MKYGYFDEAQRAYVITRPDTPRPWSNYLGDRNYGAIITHQAGGYSFARSPAEGRILRHRYNSVPQDMPGRVFYLRDRSSGDFWSACWQPVGKPLPGYAMETRFGPGYALMSSAYDGIDMQTTYFVPLRSAYEVWRLKVRNTGSEPRRLSIFSFCEFTTEWNLLNDLLNLQYAQYIARAEWDGTFIQASSCAHLPEDPTHFANRDQARYWWMTQMGGYICGFDGDRERFLGAYGDFRCPAVVQAGACTNSPGYSDNICGSIQSDLDLAPGEEQELIVLLGVGHASREGAHAVSEICSGERVDQALTELGQYWGGFLDCFQCRTPDPDFDHMTNTWGAYNALMTFEWSRSCSLIYTGDQRDGYGFRDTVQDCMGVTLMQPQQVRERLLLMLSAQESHGGAQPEVRPWSHAPGQMSPTPKEHLRSDDCLWFFNAIPLYVAESGDQAFYDVEVPYADRGTATVLGHLRRALAFNIERSGAHGLPSGLAADWNDCLKLGYQGESLFVAFQVRLGLTVYATVCEERGLAGEVDWARGELTRLDAALAKVAWDGEWFRWAIAEDGTVFGTKDYPEGQVYLNTQVWAILSGAATPTQRDQVLQVVQDRLASSWGVAICAPPFEQTPVQVMRAVLFNPGNKENAGIFSHTQSWAVLAEIMAGHGDRAYSYYRAFMPAAQNDHAEVRQIEPYVHCQSTHSQFSQRAGQSRVPWLSGTASWAHHTATHHILGIQPEANGLRINPCIPTAWPHFQVTRILRGMTLEIEVRNPHGRCRGVKHVTIDDQRIPGNFIPNDQLRHQARILVELE